MRDYIVIAFGAIVEIITIILTAAGVDAHWATFVVTISEPIELLVLATLTYFNVADHKAGKWIK